MKGSLYSRAVVSGGWALGLGAVMLAFVWILPAAAAGSQWPQVGYNAGHTGYNNTEHVINAQNVSNLAATATYQTGSQLLSTAISKGILYGWSYDQNLYAWNLATGNVDWSIPMATVDSPSVMAIGGDRLITSCKTGANQSGLCGFNPKTGKLLWTYGAGNDGQIFAPPAISGNTVYFPTSYMEVQNSDFLAAADVKTGASVWTFGSCGNNCVTIGNNAPAVDNGMVYFGCRGSGSVITVTGVCAVNAATGAYVWQTQLGCTCAGDGRGYLTAKAGTVYVAYRTAICNQCGYTLDVTALNGSTGTVLWDTPMTAQGVNQFDINAPPALGSDGTVYAGLNTSNNSSQPNQFALNGANGSILWQVSTAYAYGGSPSIVGKGKKSVLFFTCFYNLGSVCALDASTGSPLWQASSGGGAPTYDSVSPMVTGGSVYNFCTDSICSWAPP